jgi:tRNA G18 (ribose-2'-O)-methylase SpoU
MRKLKLSELNRKSIPEYKKSVKNQVVAILDNIRSGHNVGSIFRTADAFAIDHLYLAGLTPQPPHKEINKTAIGATESVDWSYDSSVSERAVLLKSEGYLIIGVEQTDKSILLDKWVPPMGQKVALIFGNEVEGLSADLLPILDLAVEIPQYGTKHSLNVSVCAGICLWHVIAPKE